MSSLDVFCLFFSFCLPWLHLVFHSPPTVFEYKIMLVCERGNCLSSFCWPYNSIIKKTSPDDDPACNKSFPSSWNLRSVYIAHSNSFVAVQCLLCSRDSLCLFFCFSFSLTSMSIDMSHRQGGVTPWVPTPEGQPTAVGRRRQPLHRSCVTAITIGIKSFASILAVWSSSTSASPTRISAINSSRRRRSRSSTAITCWRLPTISTLPRRPSCQQPITAKLCPTRQTPPSRKMSATAQQWRCCAWIKTFPKPLKLKILLSWSAICERGDDTSASLFSFEIDRIQFEPTTYIYITGNHSTASLGDLIWFQALVVHAQMLQPNNEMSKRGWEMERIIRIQGNCTFMYTIGVCLARSVITEAIESLMANPFHLIVCTVTLSNVYWWLCRIF